MPYPAAARHRTITLFRRDIGRGRGQRRAIPTTDDGVAPSCHLAPGVWERPRPHWFARHLSAPFGVATDPCNPGVDVNPCVVVVAHRGLLDTDNSRTSLTGSGTAHLRVGGVNCLSPGVRSAGRGRLADPRLGIPEFAPGPQISRDTLGPRLPKYPSSSHWRCKPSRNKFAKMDILAQIGVVKGAAGALRYQAPRLRPNSQGEFGPNSLHNPCICQTNGPKFWRPLASGPAQKLQPRSAASREIVRQVIWQRMVSNQLCTPQACQTHVFAWFRSPYCTHAHTHDHTHTHTKTHNQRMTRATTTQSAMHRSRFASPMQRTHESPSGAPRAVERDGMPLPA